MIEDRGTVIYVQVQSVVNNCSFMQVTLVPDMRKLKIEVRDRQGLNL